MTSSACSALRPRTKSWAAARPGSGIGPSGRVTRAARSRGAGSQGLCWSTGSEDATQVSLLVPSSRLEMTSESGCAPTLVSPPGRTRTAGCVRVGAVRHREGSKSDRTRLEGSGVGHGGHRRGLEDLLSHPVLRSGDDPGAQLIELPREHRPGTTGRIPATRPDREENEVVEARQHVAPPGASAAPPALRATEGELLAEQRPGELPEERGQRRVLEEATPERVEYRHSSSPNGFDKAGNPEEGVRPELDRVAPLVVDPSQDHVDRVEARQRPQPDPVVLDEQVAALDERDAEVRGQVRMLEVRLARRAGGQDDRPGLVDPVGGGPGHPGADGAEEAGQPFDPGGPVQRRQDPGEGGAVDQRIAEPGWGLGPVADRTEPAGAVAYDVDCGEEEPGNPRAVPTGAGPQECRVAEHQLCWEESLRHEPPVSVEVCGDEVEEGHALGHRLLEPAPLGLIEHEGNRIERPRSTPADPIPTDVVGGAFVAEQAGEFVTAGEQPRRPKRCQLVGNLAPVLPHRSVRRAALVPAGLCRDGTRPA